MCVSMLIFVCVLGLTQHLFKLSFIIFCSVDEDTEVAVPLADALVIIGVGEESSNED